MGYEVHGLTDQVGLWYVLHFQRQRVSGEFCTIYSSYRYRSARGREKRNNSFLYIVEQLQIEVEVTLTAVEVSAHWPVHLLFAQHNLLLSTVSALQLNLAATVIGG